MKRWGVTTAAVVVLALATSVAAQPGDTNETSTPVPMNAGVGQIEAQVTAIPLKVDVRLSRDSAAVGQQVAVRTTILNDSLTEVSGVAAELRIEGSVQVIGDASQTVGAIGPNKRFNLGWRICGTEAGAVVGVVALEGVLESGASFVAESPGFLISLTESPSQRDCSASG